MTRQSSIAPEAHGLLSSYKVALFTLSDGRRLYPTQEPCALRLRARAARRAFTLIELMIVVVIIGILAVVAAPSMRLSTYDRHAYGDAGAIMQLFRRAHARAVANSVPVVVAMSSASGDRGTFTTYQASSAQSTTGLIASCMAPFVWSPITTNAALTAVDVVNLNGAAGTAEVEANITTAINYYNAATPTSEAAAFVCFTPTGRSYFNTSAAFDGLAPNIFPLEVLVTRTSGALKRSVLVLPNGAARVFSHTW